MLGDSNQPDARFMPRLVEFMTDSATLKGGLFLYVTAPLIHHGNLVESMEKGVFT
jgi:hypothetical protein